MPAFDWAGCNKYRAGATPWPTSYPADLRTFYSPEDGTGLHDLIVDLLNSAEHSIVLNMYGFDDDQADAALLGKMSDPRVFVQLSLDSSQASGVHEKALVAKFPPGAVGNSVAIGQSTKHAISHLKVLIVDGLYVLTGSTNWSLSGEEQQDNELSLHQSAVYAAQCRSILDRNHAAMLAQMGKAAAPAPPA